MLFFKFLPKYYNFSSEYLKYCNIIRTIHYVLNIDISINSLILIINEKINDENIYAENRLPSLYKSLFKLHKNLR